MTRPDDGCLACGHEHTCSGFICARCWRQRAHTRHWRWLDLDYAKAMQAAADAKITNASEARFALRQRQGRI